MQTNTKASKRAIFSGLSWTSVSTIINGLSQVLRLSILSRFLEKSDFGIVAILTLTLGMVQVFSDLGFSSAIMSQKDLEKQDFVSLFWLQFIIYNVTMICLSLSSSLFASYYSNAAIASILPIVLFELFFISIGRLYETVLQKEMRFKTIAIRNMLAAVISIPFALILALQSFGVYSMILSTLAHAAIINIWNFMAGQSTYKMQLQRIDYKKTKGLMKVGGFQMGTQIIDYLSSKLDIIVIGIYFDVSELGLYNLSKEVVVKFSFVTNAIVNKVLLPVLTSLQNDIARLREMFCKFVRETSLLNALLTSFMFVFADVIVYYFYGEKYIEATYLVRITAICSFWGMSSNPNGLVAIAMKKTDVTFVYTIIRVIMTSVILLTFGWISMEVTMIAVLIVAIIGFFLSWKMLLNNTISLGLLTYLKRFVPSSSTFSIVSIVLMPWWIAYGDYKKISVTVVFVLVYMLVTAICVAFAERDMVKQLITKRYDAYKKQTN